MATFVLGCEILIGAYRFTRAHEIKVQSSWEELADTAVIKLPLLKGKVSKDDVQQSLADQINQGDNVEITMKYTGLDKTHTYKEFFGYVKRVSPQVPLTIECEDATWLLRRVNLERAWKQTTLKEVVQYIIEETNKSSADQITISGQIPEVKFDKFRLDNVNGAEALQIIKEKYGLVAFFKGLELFVGLAYTYRADPVIFNLAGNVLKNSLTWRKSEDTRIRLKAIAILKDNKQLEVEVPEGGSGELRTKFYYDISDKATLKAIAQKDIEGLKFEGYEGNLVTYLVPFVAHSAPAEIRDPEYKKRNGSYLVDAVETTFGKGIRRKVKIGKKL